VIRRGTIHDHRGAQSKGRRPEQPSAPAAQQATKRFTIDVPIDLHSRIKVGCARRGLKMADVLRELLEREFPPALKS